MTAEIAILNKTAVALAADSAVTISAGNDQKKVYDSEDKLFELSRHDAIGVMINNNMHFMAAPLPVLIKRYRAECPRFERVPDAANHFLKYLQKFGSEAPESVTNANIAIRIGQVFKLLEQRAQNRVWEKITSFQSGNSGPPDQLANIRELALSTEVDAMQRYLGPFPVTNGIGRRRGVKKTASVINGLIEARFDYASGDLKEKLHALACVSLAKRFKFLPNTGIVFAGFGKDDLFPTLMSFEIYGMLDGQLRVHQTNFVDIDRDGDRARVLPFAQKEMVERFLYGLDDNIQRQVSKFCNNAVPKIREKLISQFEMAEDDRRELETQWADAEKAFLGDLKEKTFDLIREQSRVEIEDMVEFMPKSEMARMAEALVNLTSIKRRVSVGMETVGGPIDCAVISQADGFVWVKRKHYFAQELNPRYFDRMRHERTEAEVANGSEQ